MRQQAQVTASPAAESLSDEFIDAVCHRLTQERPVRRALPGDGRLHIDRRLPFLCVYRDAASADDSRRSRRRAERLLARGEGAYLIAPGGEENAARVSQLVEAVVRAQADAFGAFLLMELWPGPAGSRAFRVVGPSGLGADEEEPTFVSVLKQSLGEVKAFGSRLASPAVESAPTGAVCAPPGLSPLLTVSAARRMGCTLLGLEVPPLYRDENGAILHQTLHAFRAELSRALHRCFHEFAQVQTNWKPGHYHALGRKAVVRAVWEADRELARISGSFDFLLSVTPVNADAAFAEFVGSGFSRPPSFHYCLLTQDFDRLKRRLYDLRLEHIEDPTLSRLLREKRRELDRQITLLEDRDTPAFAGGSLALYGRVEDDLLAEARQILDALPPGSRSGGGKGGTEAAAYLDGPTFARLAREEIARYREGWPKLTAEARLSDDVPGIMVSGGNLLVGRRTKVAERRAEAVLHHEVGTHLLTYANGAAQPLALLARGLPGYDSLQEGLAVLAEYLTGGLTPSRLRTLAARVVAVRMQTEGAEFVEVFRALRDGHGFGERAAFLIAMRVFRGGGLTKDAVYLRGLRDLLRHLRGCPSGGEAADTDSDLLLLWAGKAALEHLPLLEELRWRGVLRWPPPLRPRFLDDERAAARLRALRERDVNVLDLLEAAGEE